MKKEKIGKYNKVEVPTSLGKLEPDLVNKLSSYSTLIEEDRLKLVAELIEKELEEKVLTNEFIYPEEIYYFNFTDLLENKEAIASKEKPKTDLDNVFIVKKIPNNLDVFDKDKRTFCYNGIAEKHLGIYSYNKIDLMEDKVNETNFSRYFILFEYDSKTEELVLKLTNIDSLILLFDINDFEKILSDLASINRQYKEAEINVKKLPDNAPFEDLFSLSGINLGLYLFSLEVIQSLSEAKLFSLSISKVKPEAYEQIKGKCNSEDLIIFTDVNIESFYKEDNKAIASKEEGDSNNA